MLNRRALIITLCAGLTLAACTQTVLHHGHLPRKGELEQLREGMSKAEVEALLGSPSTTATISTRNDSYYYISSKMKQRGFLPPEEVDRRVLAIRFDENGLVKSFAVYTLQDGQVVQISGRKTPAAGRELGFIRQMLSNLGRFTKG